MNILEHLKEHLQDKVVILGIGNTLRSDDGAGSILSSRIKGRVPYIVYDCAESPENYLGKVGKDSPDTLLLIDALDFGAQPGEFNIYEASDIQAINFFSTHDASMSVLINYLQSKVRSDIIILGIQPKSTSFGENLSPEVTQTLNKLEEWFIGEAAQEKR
jgi:hydrogenase 3 maturation protease